MMIDWNTVITTLLASSALTTIALTVLGYVAKNIFSQLLSRDIENFKNSKEMELERFKADLQKSAFEHQTRYQSLHIKRAEIISELYSLLFQAEQDTIWLAHPFQEGGLPVQIRKRDRAYKSGKALSDFFGKNRIYFKQDTCERIANFVNGLYNALNEFNVVIDALENHNINGKERTEHWAKVWEKLTEDLPVIKADIEIEFREILGLEKVK
jgi:hypothetical protein